MFYSIFNVKGSCEQIDILKYDIKKLHFFYLFLKTTSHTFLEYLQTFNVLKFIFSYIICMGPKKAEGEKQK